MISQWDVIQKRHDELSQKIASGDVSSNERNVVQKEYSVLGEILEKKKKLDVVLQKQEDVQKALNESTDPEWHELYQEELNSLARDYKHLNVELEDLIYPQDEHGSRSAFIEIRSGAGGQEAALFGSDLLRMYTNYALSRGWKPVVESLNYTDLGGLREAVLNIKGKGAFGALKREAGVHRVQRVPQTETAGRVHTSTATVAVFPEVENDAEMEINPADLRIDVYRASGAGGQHVNTTDSAVRITHIPTGVVVSCQDERSQHKNKAKAMKVLKSRILAAQIEKQAAEEGQKRKDMVGSGMRSEKVRTYNFPQNRVTDHQVDITLKKLDMFMEGQMNEIIEPLMDLDKRLRKKNPFLEALGV
ncbi:MAG: Peptide chain release factor 1 [candidate division TM6 bacterium GW2011_GWF2_32_72]|nr:MAG: Peptide chain release factor 1 [candidate division TM6 bacterium GW2011_GWF2_32_72]